MNDACLEAFLHACADGEARAKWCDICLIFDPSLRASPRPSTPTIAIARATGLQWLDLSYCTGWSRLHPGLRTLRVAVFDHTTVSGAQVRRG